MKEFLIMLHDDLVQRSHECPHAESEAFQYALTMLDPTDDRPWPATVGQAIGYWKLGVESLLGKEPYEPFRISPNGDVIMIIPE